MPVFNGGWLQLLFTIILIVVIVWAIATLFPVLTHPFLK